MTVWCAALAALLWLLLPRWWSGLALLPVFAWWGAWVALGGRYRALHELDRELDGQDDEPGPLDCCEHCEHDVGDPPHEVPCPDGCNQAAELDPLPEMVWPGEITGPLAGVPAADQDPVGHYAAQAWQRATGEPAPGWWQEAHAGWTDERPVAVLDDHGAWASGPALDQPLPPYVANGLNNPETAPGPAGVLQTPTPGPVPNTGGPAAADNGTGEAGPPAELDHTAVTDVQAAELATWPAADDLAADTANLAADSALDRIRAEFDLLRRMWL